MTIEDIHMMCVPGRRQDGSDTIWFAYVGEGAAEKQLEIGRGSRAPKLSLDGWKNVARLLADSPTLADPGKSSCVPYPPPLRVAR